MDIAGTNPLDLIKPPTSFFVCFGTMMVDYDDPGSLLVGMEGPYGVPGLYLSQLHARQVLYPLHYFSFPPPELY